MPRFERISILATVFCFQCRPTVIQGGVGQRPISGRQGRFSAFSCLKIHAKVHSLHMLGILGHLPLLLELLLEPRWLGSVVVGCRTCDREVASSTPGRCTAGYSLRQLSLPSLRCR